MATTPFQQLVKIIEGTTPPSNLGRKVKPLLYENKIPVDKLLEAANMAVLFMTADIEKLFPWAGDSQVPGLRKRMEDNVEDVDRLNRLDSLGEWEVVHKAETQEAILTAVVLRRELHDLMEQLKKRQKTES